MKINVATFLELPEPNFFQLFHLLMVGLTYRKVCFKGPKHQTSGGGLDVQGTTTVYLSVWFGLVR